MKKIALDPLTRIYRVMENKNKMKELDGRSSRMIPGLLSFIILPYHTLS